MKWKKTILSKAYRYPYPTTIPDQWQEFSVRYREKKIAGRHLPCPHYKSKKGVILIHPYKIYAKDYFLTTEHPTFYQENGYEVFIFDFNTFGESEERADYDFYLDLLTVADFIKKQYHIDSLHAHGFSFGAAVLIRTLVEKEHPFEKVIIENAMDDLLNYYRKRNKWIFYTLLLGMQIYPGLTKDFKIYNLLKKAHLRHPALLLYAENDELTTVNMGQRLHQSIPNHSKLVVLKGEHLSSIQADPDRYRKVLSLYLEK